MKVSELVFNEQEGIFVNPDNIIDYSDGEKNEQYIYDSLKNSNDNSIFSSFLHKQIRDWSSEYHFSTYRSNIVRTLPIEKHHNILEIGSGCGAITRYLGETGAEITSVEGSFSRARCTRQRCKDLQNVKVICSNVEEIEFEEKFDIVTLIGVFEYTAKYSKREDPFRSALHHYSSLLKPDGMLVIAIENKLGLKYFSGYNEDHLGVPYYGLEDRYKEKDVRTFGRLELQRLLSSCGFENMEFQYPFPDYKLPKVVISEEGLEKEEFNASDLIRSTWNRHYSPKPKANTLNDSLVCDVLVKNKVMKDFSNSFLIMARKGKEEPVNKKFLANYYTCDRHEPYNTYTNFSKGQNGIAVTKNRLGNEGGQSSKTGTDTIRMHIENETAYIEGSNLHHKILDALYKKRYTEYEGLLKAWIQFLRNEALEESTKGEEGSDVVKSEFFDALPFNIIVDKGGRLSLFDQEWKIEEQFDITFLLIRYLSMYKRKWGLYRGYSGSYFKFVNKTLNACGLKSISKSKLKKLEKQDEEIRLKINRPTRIAPLQIKKSLAFLFIHKFLEIKNYFLHGTFAQR